MRLRMSGVLWLAAFAAAVMAVPFGCGGGHASKTSTGISASGSGGPGGGGGAGGEGFVSSSGGIQTLTSVTVDPPSPSLVIQNGMPAMQPFMATAHFSDKTTQPLASGVTWAADSAGVGQIDSAGVYTANGMLGGTVSVQAQYQGVTGSATLTVKLMLASNPGSAPASVVTALEGASAPDGSTVWAYPYDGTVWPRGLLPPLLQWNGGAATDVYLVHLANKTFDLEQIGAAQSAPASQLSIDPTTWQQFVDSSSGPTSVTVARWDGSGATVVASQTWTIAPQSMRGTIYYWSNDLGRVLRIQPGAATPDDFANAPPLSDPTQYQQDSCLMTCHTVSADGSTLVSGGGTFGGSYDLKAGMPLHSLGGTWGVDPNQFGQPEWANIAWYQPALSPDGTYVLTNSMGQGGVTSTGGPNMDMGLFTSADGMPVANSGVAGAPFAEPAWSPDGTKVAFVDSGDPSAWFNNWQTPPAGDLEVIPFDASQTPMFGAAQTMVSVGTSTLITWPSVAPNGQWVVYSRAQSADTRQGNGDLYMASATTPNQEQRLSALDGDGYPFAAGARDLHWNYEPSFAPVAAGGYFWVVFTSRRTYGNVLTGDKTVVKQLWVAAIDQNPTPGKDPSHPPFHLTGQAANLAMRGFWSLPPCKSDGMSCMTGTDCCGGYCNASQMCMSMSSGCAQDGDKCSMNSDCCGVGQGATCINHVCSEAPPN